MTIFELFCSLSKLLLATTSPGLMPVTAVLPASVTPVLIFRICAVSFWMTINKRGLAVVLNGRSRNQRDTLFGIHQQPGIHELVGKERVVLVIEERAHLHGPGGGIDLIVEGKELAEWLAWSSEPDQKRPPQSCLPWRVCACTWARLSSATVKITVMGCTCVMTAKDRVTGRLNNIAGIDQPQTDPPCDRRSDMAEGDLNLVVLHRALVVLDGAFILQHELFLVIERLFLECRFWPTPR